ncbi:MAG: hypothetical protein IIW55_03240 [Bacteroidales bacterium]|nr:hypothetical protein [Bacteroidales bacterium]MBQ5856304.1 hypothetical protein [Bacteroidales bacterium]
MKRLFLLLLVFSFMLTPNVANNICDGVKFIDAKCVNDDDAKYIKDVSLYTYDGYKYKKCCTGLLYEVICIIL